METWLARALVDKYGEDLCGIVVATEEIGDYEGGLAEIIEIEPDINAPEISFNVLRYRNNEVLVMGIFEWENVGVYSTDIGKIYSF